jgi:hypothetical protein
VIAVTSPLPGGRYGVFGADDRRIDMTKVIKTTSTGISRILARFGARIAVQRTYRWYEVEVASF